MILPTTLPIYGCWRVENYCVINRFIKSGDNVISISLFDALVVGNLLRNINMFLPVFKYENGLLNLKEVLFYFRDVVYARRPDLRGSIRFNSALKCFLLLFCSEKRDFSTFVTIPITYFEKGKGPIRRGNPQIISIEPVKSTNYNIKDRLFIEMNSLSDPKVINFNLNSSSMVGSARYMRKSKISGLDSSIKLYVSTEDSSPDNRMNMIGDSPTESLKSTTRKKNGNLQVKNGFIRHWRRKSVMSWTDE